MPNTTAGTSTPLEVMKVMGVSVRELRLETKFDIETLSAALRGTHVVDVSVRTAIAEVLGMEVSDIKWIEPGAAKAPPPGEVVAEAPSTEPLTEKAQGVCDVHFLTFNAAGECSYCDA